MNAQLAGVSVLSLDLVAAIVVGSMIAGAVDLLRQPGWAWRRAEESKAAYCVLVLLVPLVGLGMYLVSARPKVATIAAAGRAASLPFERFGDDIAQQQREDGWPIGTIAPPERFDGVGATTVGDGVIRLVEASGVGNRAPADAVSPSMGSGGTATRTAPVGLARTYHPKQRTELPVDPTAAGARPAVPAGWKADPTGRHQFRYWDGAHWTENVADAGNQSRDAVLS
jgi:hypothetical protein